MEEGWCWRAAERRSKGLSAPEDPRECLAPCPPCTERAEEVLDLVQLAHRQVRVGFGGVYGLDWNVLARLADDAGIPTPPGWWLMITVVEGILVEKLNPPKKPDTEE